MSWAGPGSMHVSYERLDLLAPSDVDWFKKIQDLERENWPGCIDLKFAHGGSRCASVVTGRAFHVYAAKQGANGLLGYVVFDCTRRPGRPTSTYMDDVGVAGHARGRGVARDLIGFAIADMLRNGADPPWTKYLVDTPGAIAVGRLYERCGFRPVGDPVAGELGHVQFLAYNTSSPLSPRASWIR
jgi:GNAT superfamily N-acetyltransferase